MTDDIKTMAFLTRMELKYGVGATRDALDKIAHARQLFYDELGYNITRKQFEALQQANEQQKQEEIQANFTREEGRNIKVGRQQLYRDRSSGQFVKHPETEGRNQQIKNARENGQSVKTISEHYHLSETQVRRITK